MTSEREPIGSEGDFQTALMSAIDGILVVDLHGTVLFANPMAETLLGRGASLEGRPFGMPLASTDHFAELDHVSAAGSHLIVEMHVAPIFWSGIGAYIVTLHDITEQKTVERRLRESEQRYALAAEGANDGVWDWDLVTNHLYISPRWREILGVGDINLTESPEEWFGRAHPEDVAALRLAVARHLKAEGVHFVHEHRLRHRNGSFVPVLGRGVAVHDEGKPVRFAGSLTDLTTRQELSYRALHDGLTGLGNRALFIDHLESAIDRERRRLGEFRFAVLFLDLDRFKLVNDSLGHSAGDTLLTTAAKRIQNCLRAVDTACRLGGDEFAVLLEDVSGIEAVITATRRIQDVMARPIDIGGESVYTSASIGIVLGVQEHATADDVLRNADIAMYRAKSGGPGNWEIFDDGMHRQELQRLRLHTEMRRAVERSEFFVRYQPMVDLADGQITGFEALLRWHRPGAETADADAFIGLAEDTGMLLPLGWNALESACHQVSAWREMDSHLRVSVNVSNRQFAQVDFADQVERAIDDAGVDGSALQLEITEGVIVQDHEAAAYQLERCHALGIELLIDDFGTGHSSLTALHRLPLDGVKIDRSFVNRVEREEGGKMVETIVGLARNLRLNVIAEGIETRDQCNRLLELGCSEGQGYLFAPAVDPAEATQLLHAGR